MENDGFEIVMVIRNEFVCVCVIVGLAVYGGWGGGTSYSSHGVCVGHERQDNWRRFVNFIHKALLKHHTTDSMTN